jgi:riboflavin synthase alpha subunit
MSKIKVYKIAQPESHSAIIASADELKERINDLEVGESISIEAVELTEKELKQIPVATE